MTRGSLRDRKGQSLFAIICEAAVAVSEEERPLIMMTSLVTGGAGFIGSHVAQALLDRGHAVTIVDDLSGGSLANVPSGAAFVEGSVVSADVVDALFSRYRFDYVFHLAAYAAEGLSHFIRRFNYTNNVIGSVNLINASVNNSVKCFVFTSSIAVYGAAQVPMAEETVPLPEDPYGVAKYSVELDLKAAHEMFGLNHVIFRPHNVYGEHQNIADRYRNVIGIFMNQIMRGEPMTIFGDGGQKRAFSYIKDVAPAIAAAAETPAAYNETYNIGADIPYSVNELAHVVAASMGENPGIRHLPARREVRDAFASHDKVRAMFGNRSPVPLDEGILRMAKWAREVGARASGSFGQLEIRRNLPSSWLD
jgi:UDP-glucose 4-epimerase